MEGTEGCKAQGSRAGQSVEMIRGGLVALVGGFSPPLQMLRSQAGAILQAGQSTRERREQAKDCASHCIAAR